jgi:hypothetical protein
MGINIEYNNKFRLLFLQLPHNTFATKLAPMQESADLEECAWTKFGGFIVGFTGPTKPLFVSGCFVS